MIEGQSPNVAAREDAQAKYSLCLNVLYDFSHIFVSASLIHKLFEGLQAGMHGTRRLRGRSFFGHDRPSIDGLRVSSDITNEIMKELVVLLSNADTLLTTAQVAEYTLCCKWQRCEYLKPAIVGRSRGSLPNIHIRRVRETVPTNGQFTRNSGFRDLVCILKDAKGYWYLY